jgi:hypothetical protein
VHSGDNELEVKLRLLLYRQENIPHQPKLSAGAGDEADIPNRGEPLLA